MSDSPGNPIGCPRKAILPSTINIILPSSSGCLEVVFIYITSDWNDVDVEVSTNVRIKNDEGASPLVPAHQRASRDSNAP